MGWVITPYSIVLALSLVVAAGTALSAWRTRPAAGATALTALMATVVVWLGTHILEIESTTLAWKLRWADVQWACAAVIPTLFLVFALEYTGKDRWLTRRRVGLLAIEPLIMIGLLTINGRTHVLWGPPHEKPIALGSWWTSSATVATSEPSIGLFAHLGYATLCLAITSVLVVAVIARSQRLYRWQGVAVFVAIAVPWATAVLSASSLEIVGTTPIGFTITGLAITFGLYRYRLLELTPIARSEVVANLEDGVLVIDADRRVVDCNPVARELFASDRLVGEPVDTVVPIDVDTVIDAPTDRNARDERSDPDTEDCIDQFSLEDGTDRRHYELSTSPIDDGRGQPIGWTVVVHDVTDRVRRARELERKNRRLDEFADVVSHDLRNPLSVSKGYLELLEEEYDPEYVRTVADSHERMEQLIDDVLALARQGRAALDLRPVSLADVATEAWSTVETDDATLSIASDGVCTADRTQLRQLLENLFRNAVDHGSTSPASQARQDAVDHGRAEPRSDRVDAGHGDDHTLVVTVETLDDGFAVTDSGTGFGAEPARLFESGYTTSDRGTGLGLSIVADICEAHGWSVTAAEDACGGARFEITGVDFLEAATNAAAGESLSRVGEEE
ncbi:histidine kinase N-terminal 7TM domain-containing protein [Natrinema marinum]|uniref:histidine kinase N-terminal 7TM domain-containing protein n=1 Tax=Natrinema marinum TaxID=2961598 RepID=UPI0020C8D080|nr:histidine kinase N-terminal 7TM domain-containing protein [Natrinema marinum]